MTDLVSVVKEMCKLKYEIEDVGILTDYLGMQVKNLEHGRIELTQKQLIFDIIKDLCFNPNTKPTRNSAL